MISRILFLILISALLEISTIQAQTCTITETITIPAVGSISSGNSSSISNACRCGDGNDPGILCTLIEIDFSNIGPDQCGQIDALDNSVDLEIIDGETCELIGTGADGAINFNTLTTAVFICRPNDGGLVEAAFTYTDLGCPPEPEPPVDLGCNCTISQAGQSFDISAIQGDESAVSFYQYNTPNGASSNTSFELADAASMFLYEDTQTGEVSLVVILDDITARGDADGGAAEMSFDCLPATATVDLADDGTEVSGSGMNVMGDWAWAPCCTDGAVVGGIDCNSSFSFSVDIERGINSFRWLSGSDNVALNPDIIELPSFTDFITISCISGGDKDKDGVADVNDVDDDNDGLTDIEESNGNDPDVDADGDGVLALFDDDDMNASIGDVDGLINPNFPDTDSDGYANHLDQDSDNDGIPDAIEACGFGTSLLLCAQNIQPDCDGSVDTCFPPVDTDDDGVPDYLDLDSDGDCLADVDEAGIIDSDCNGISGLGNPITNDCGVPLAALDENSCLIPPNENWIDPDSPSVDLADQHFSCEVTPTGALSLSGLLDDSVTNLECGDFSGTVIYGFPGGSGSIIGGTVFTYTTPGCFEVEYFKEGPECDLEATGYILVTEQPQPSFTAPSILCYQTTNFNIVPTINSPVYESPAADLVRTFSIESGPATIVDVATGELTITGTGPVTLKMTEVINYAACGSFPAGSCMEMFIVTIDVQDGDAPDPGFQLEFTKVCPDDIVNIRAVNDGGTFTGVGVTDNGDGTATFTSSETGVFAVTYTLNSSGGCTSTETANIIK